MERRRRPTVKRRTAPRYRGVLDSRHPYHKTRSSLCGQKILASISRARVPRRDRPDSASQMAEDHGARINETTLRLRIHRDRWPCPMTSTDIVTYHSFLRRASGVSGRRGRGKIFFDQNMLSLRGRLSDWRSPTIAKRSCYT